MIRMNFVEVVKGLELQFVVGFSRNQRASGFQSEEYLTLGYLNRNFDP
jgi:hypothetical protein